ncbi:hypothetical protein BT93_A1988 [Corymbia citriodora subsp. variegata]|nr:hypothetical protein BT93_A1988 [Corymbia citriodora subsp. variegata]
MEPTSLTLAGSTDAALESLFNEEIRRLMAPPPETASSFTELLELPPTRAIELLHSPEAPNSPGVAVSGGPAMPPLHCLGHGGGGGGGGYAFAVDSDLVERAASYPAFAGEKNDSLETSSQTVKKEPLTESDSNHNSSSQPLVSDPTMENMGQRPLKRKDREKKISGTASVLDEIINHVQSLQRQVELLSMRLAAVNPRVDFNMDSIFAAENMSLVDSNFPSMVIPQMWPEVQVNGSRQQYHQQWQFNSLPQPVWGREQDNHNFVTPENSLLSYDSPANSVSLHSRATENGAVKVD